MGLTERGQGGERMTGTAEGVPDTFLCLLPPDVARIVQSAVGVSTSALEEVRMRCDRPLELVGVPHYEALMIREEHIRHTLAVITGSSMYAVSEELRRGFITAPGGHRVGIAGRAVLDDAGKIQTIRDIGSLNVRLARAIPGAARALSDCLVSGDILQPALLIGPPLSGKTTLLRDIARMIASGTFHPRLRRKTLAIVDERSELAACRYGVPQFDVGLSTDVLDGCPKREGMSLMLRSMAPQVIITDEVGHAEDAEAIANVATAGVTFIGSAHVSSIRDLSTRPALSHIVHDGIIARYVLLSRRRGVGTVEKVYDSQLREVMTRCLQRG